MGRLEDPENLPFSEATGMIPDVVVAEESFGSRMTLGKLIECLTGKAVALSGWKELGVEEADFGDHKSKLETVKKVLLKHGFSPSGTEVMVNGKTGEIMTCPIFMGIVYYGRLNHLVAKKAHARAEGPTQLLTRQPMEGRRLAGGIKISSMQTECLVAHGAASVIRSQTSKLSDAATVYRCQKCGLDCIGNEALDLQYCDVCQSADHVHAIEMAHASHNLLFPELAANGISTRFNIQTLDPKTE